MASPSGTGGTARRLLSCIEQWPECEEGSYHPSCCRFPKSCSCSVYDPATTPDSELEPVPAERGPSGTGHDTAPRCPACNRLLESGGRCHGCGTTWLPADLPPVAVPEWTCASCGSHRWVAVSLNGGRTRVPQCVPCGRISGEIPTAPVAVPGPASVSPVPSSGSSATAATETASTRTTSGSSCAATGAPVPDSLRSARSAETTERSATPVAADPVVSPADTPGVELIAAERQRQIAAEGWTTSHDDAHDSGELVYAAIAYAYSPFSDVRQAPDGDHRKPAGTAVPEPWPWEDEWWKPTPKDRVRELTKAGALIAAEIDRLQRSPMAADPGTRLLRGSRRAVSPADTIQRDYQEACYYLERHRASDGRTYPEFHSAVRFAEMFVATVEERAALLAVGGRDRRVFKNLSRAYEEAIAELVRDRQRIAQLTEALTRAIQVIEWCGLNDRTPTYEYGETRRDGFEPRPGCKFNTPREFADWWPDRLRAVLAVEEDAE